MANIEVGTNINVLIHIKIQTLRDSIAVASKSIDGSIQTLTNIAIITAIAIIVISPTISTRNLILSSQQKRIGLSRGGSLVAEWQFKLLLSFWVCSACNGGSLAAWRCDKMTAQIQNALP